MINAGLTQPLLTFGRLSGSLDFSNARDRQSAEKYKQTVLTAFKEVNDALVAHLKYGEQKKAQEDSVAAERVRLRLTRARYDIGYSNFLQCWTPTAACSKRSTSSRTCSGAISIRWCSSTRRWAAGGARPTAR